MGKPRGVKSGSARLGAELRRLRGGRTLDDIVQLSRARTLTRRIRPIAAPTLSQIENGVVLPTVESLATLAFVYKVSPAHLINILAIERLTEDASLPETLEATKAAHADAVRAGAWDDALGLATHCERLATTAPQRATWRADAAVALGRLGLKREALFTLLECLESIDLPENARAPIHKSAADILAALGMFREAENHARRALELAGLGMVPADRARLLRTIVVLKLRPHEFGARRDDASLREAQRLIAEARQLSGGDVGAGLLLDIYEGETHEHLGNSIVAARDYARTARVAAAASLNHLAAAAWALLGVLRRKQGKLSEADTALEKAESHVDATTAPDTAFEIVFNRLLVARQRGERAAERIYLRRCLRLWPLLEARTPSVLTFEVMASVQVAR